MGIELRTPGVDEVGAAVAALRDWQDDAAPSQLHPGDVAWSSRLGMTAAAAAVRTWWRAGRVLGVGMLDGPDVFRLTFAPDAYQDAALAERVAADIAGQVLPAGEAWVEAPATALLQDVLADAGWGRDGAWTPLRRDLTDPVEDSGLRIEVVTGAAPALVSARTQVQRSAFGTSKHTDERWYAMAEGPLYGDARCLVGFDEHDVPVAMITVWPAGPGRPGLVEPMGVHAEHRRCGHGRAITVAGAAALRDLGASSAIVCTPSSQAGAVPTYEAAGFQRRPEVLDRHRA